MCETNALKAYRASVGPITRFEWLVRLSDALINNPFIENAGAAVGGDDAAAAGGAGASTSAGVCGNQ